MSLSTVILAAGKGSRTAASLPKVMQTLGGLPLLQHVINTAKQLSDNRLHVVYRGSDVPLADSDIVWVLQETQCGTAHAVQQALPYSRDEDRVLILYGDVPLIRAQTLQRFVQQIPFDSLGILTAQVANPFGLGRIIRNANGEISAIIEERDATEAQRQIHEINTGMMLCPAGLLKRFIPLLQAHNQQQEYYLTDIVALAVAEGISVESQLVEEVLEISGVNDLWQLAQLERVYQQERAKEFALAGVKFLDYQRFDVRGADIRIAPDVVIDVNVVLEGRVHIARNTVVGAHCVLKDCDIGEGVSIFPNTVIEGAVIKSGCQVGPFARIRPHTVLEEGSKVGNFVEMKQTHLGKSSKANHLSYLGDAHIGHAVNIGAGTITCNYDGAHKHQTVIGDAAFIGSNTALVAPLTVGESATIAAGSTVTQDAPAKALTVARAKQKSFAHWCRPKKK